MKLVLTVVVVLLCLAASTSQAKSKNFSAKKDSSIFEEDGGLTCGKCYHILVGRRYSIRGANSEARRGLLRFHLANKIFPGDVVKKAKLKLYCGVQRPGASSPTHDIHRVLKSWGETSPSFSLGLVDGRGHQASGKDVTWTWRKFNAKQWSSPGGDYKSVRHLALVSTNFFVVCLLSVLCCK